MRIDNTEMDVVRRHSKRIYSYIKRRVFFFFNDTATTEIYTLSLHDALPISANRLRRGHRLPQYRAPGPAGRGGDPRATRPVLAHLLPRDALRRLCDSGGTPECARAG